MLTVLGYFFTRLDAMSLNKGRQILALKQSQAALADLNVQLEQRTTQAETASASKESRR
jgi:hypothetical protein